MDALARKDSRGFLASLEDRDFIQVEEAGLRGIGFLLLDVADAVVLAEARQLGAEQAEADLHERLVRFLPEADAVLLLLVAAADDGADVIRYAVVYDDSGRLEEVVPCLVVPVLRDGIHAPRAALELLPVRDALQLRHLLVPAPVDGFELASVHEERRPERCDAGREVVPSSSQTYWMRKYRPRQEGTMRTSLIRQPSRRSGTRMRMALPP